MKATVLGFALVIWLTMAAAPASSQTRQPPRSQYSPLAAQRGEHPQQRSQTWYEFALSRINPRNIKYGAWMEERRRAFLEATAKNPYFNYGLGSTIVILFLMVTSAKFWIDGRRKDWVTAEMMTDLLNQDQYSREVAKEAIRKYNDHIERCNRVVEAAESGHPIPGSATEVQELRARLQETEDNLGSITRDKNKLDTELEEKKLLVTKLSLRLDGVTRKTNGDGEVTVATQVAAVSAGEESETSRLMQHINNLQQQLYTEREKNKRLKGA